MAELADWQWELGGVVFGSGCPAVVGSVDGVGRPPLRTADTDAPGEDGGWAGLDLWAAREVSFTGHATVPGQPEDVPEALEPLSLAWEAAAARASSLATSDLRVKLPGRTVRRLEGRPRRFDLDLASLVVGQVRWAGTYVATDPRWYADTPETLVLGVDISGSVGGVSAPVVAPVTTTGFTVTERPGTLANEGTADSWPVVTFTGPAQNPSVVSLATGVTIALNTVLSGADRVVVDCRPGRRQVVLNGSANVSGLLARGSRPDLFRIVPGTQEFRFTAVDATATARCTITAASAWPSLL